VSTELSMPEPLVSTEKAAEFLGFTEPIIRQMAKAGRIPCYRYGLGKRIYYRFRLSELAPSSMRPQAQGSR